MENEVNINIGELGKSTQLFIFYIFLIISIFLLVSFLPKVLVSWVIFSQFVYYGIVDSFIFNDSYY